MRTRLRSTTLLFFFWHPGIPRRLLSKKKNSSSIPSTQNKYIKQFVYVYYVALKKCDRIPLMLQFFTYLTKAKKIFGLKQTVTKRLLVVFYEWFFRLLLFFRLTFFFIVFVFMSFSTSLKKMRDTSAAFVEILRRAKRGHLNISCFSAH